MEVAFPTGSGLTRLFAGFVPCKRSVGLWPVEGAGNYRRPAASAQVSGSITCQPSRLRASAAVTGLRCTAALSCWSRYSSRDLFALFHPSRGVARRSRMQNSMMSSRHGRKRRTPTGRWRSAGLLLSRPLARSILEDVGFAVDMDVCLGEFVGRLPHEVVCEYRSRVVVRLERVGALVWWSGTSRNRLVQACGGRLGTDAPVTGRLSAGHNRQPGLTRSPCSRPRRARAGPCKSANGRRG